MKKYILIAAAFVISLCSSAQTTTWTADIQSVDLSAYYNIELDQRLVGGANKDFSDLRVLVSKGQDKQDEVPYFVRSVNPVESKSRFEPYKLIENRAKDSINLIVLDNSAKDLVNRFYLVYKNADVNIDMTIRGSDNLKKWYVVKQRSAVSNYRNANGTDAVLILDFPEGDYKYYEIVLTSNQNSPLDVREVSKMSSSSIYGQFVELNVGKFVQTEDKDNRTVITFPELKDAYRVEKIEVTVDSETVYMRRAQLKDTINYDTYSFQLSSKSANTFFVDDFKMQGSTRLSIENNNNPALKITSVKVYGLKRYVCAHLNSQMKYSIAIDAKKYSSPDYDIQQFKDDLAVDLMETSTQKVESQKHEIVENVRERMFIEEPIVLWSVIIGLGLFLTFICVKMVKKMKEEDR